MTSRKLIAGFLCPFLVAVNVCFFSSSWATTPLPEVVVHGESRARSSQSEAQTVIPASRFSHRITSVAEILSEQVGLHLTRFGGLEEMTAISIRGSSSDEVLIYLDGIPLNSAEGGGADLSPVLMDTVESIAIERNPTPADTGMTPAAGLVFLRSKKIAEGRHVGASFGYGSFNTIKGHAFYSQSRNRFGFLASTAVSSTSGDFTFLDDNGTPLNKNDDQKIKRQNNASRTVHPFFKLFYRFDDKTRLEMATHFMRKENGVPGFSSNQSDTADLSTTLWMTHFRFMRDHFFHKNLSLTDETFFRLTKSQYSDRGGEIGLGGAQDNDDDTTLFGKKETVDFFWGDHQVVSLFTLYQFERFRPENFLASPPQGGASSRHLWNVGLRDEIDWLDHRLFVSPSVWMENVFNRVNNDDPSFLTPATFSNSRSHHEVSGQLSVKGVPFPFLFLEGHVGRSFRFPTFPELFGDRGGVVGNPFLDPQKNLFWDAGFTLTARPLQSVIHEARLTVFYFDRQTDDLIQFQQNAGFARAENVGRARINGVEVSSHVSFWDHVGFTANYTFQRARDEAQNRGRFLPGRPQHEVNATLEGGTKKFRAFASANWMDKNFLDPLNTRVVDDRLIINSGISAKPHPRWEISAEAKNLSNDQVVDVIGFPLPGRSFYGRITYTL